MVDWLTETLGPVDIEIAARFDLLGVLDLACQTWQPRSRWRDHPVNHTRPRAVIKEIVVFVDGPLSFIGVLVFPARRRKAS